MKPTSTVILPGLDGTGLLLDQFCELTDNGTVLSLPDDPQTDYAKLCDHFSTRIRSLESVHLIAESFSGPLGILLAHRCPEIITRLTLVATFASPPAPFAARFVPWPILFRLPLPSWVARRYFVGANQSVIAKLKNAVRQTSPQTLARRMSCLMNVDVTTQLSELKCNIVYLRPKQDRLVSRRSLDTIRAANPNVSVREIDGPHLSIQTQPEQVWACIREGHRVAS